MKLLTACTASALFIYLCGYALHHSHDGETSYRKADQDAVSRLLDEPKPVKLVRMSALAYLYPDYEERSAKRLPSR